MVQRNQKIVVANWKMNGSISMVEDFLEKYAKYKFSNCILCLPYPYIQHAKTLVDKKLLDIKIGAQNCHHCLNGAYTGDISAQMIKEIGSDYCIIGHSERLKYDSNTEIMNKFDVLADFDIKPILCLGEKIDLRYNFKDFIKKQIIELLPIDKIFQLKLSDFMIAYEPIWSIGTGIIPLVSEIKDRVNFIKEVIDELFFSFNEKTQNTDFIKITSDNIKILYGGSINNNNISEIVKISSVDGVLVGGISLKFNEFFEILDTCNKF